MPTSYPASPAAGSSNSPDSPSRAAPPRRANSLLGTLFPGFLSARDASATPSYSVPSSPVAQTAPTSGAADSAPLPPPPHHRPRRRTQSMVAERTMTSSAPADIAPHPSHQYDYDVFAAVRVGTSSSRDLEDARRGLLPLHRARTTSTASASSDGVLDSEADVLRSVEMSVMFAPE